MIESHIESRMKKTITIHANEILKEVGLDPATHRVEAANRVASYRNTEGSFIEIVVVETPSRGQSYPHA